MNEVIRLPGNLYERLKKHAYGFDTPVSVIEKILNYYEKHREEPTEIPQEQPGQSIELPIQLEIIYRPGGENIFKKALLEKKQAYVCLYKIDGTSEINIWNASKFTPRSDVNNNLRSGYLRNWKKKGIFKAVIAIDKTDIA